MALSVAVTPVLGHAALAMHAVNPSGATVTSHHQSHAADLADCHSKHSKQTKPMEKSAGDRECTGICALMYLSYAKPTSIATLVFPLQADSVPPLTVQSPRARTGSAPFRPPRV